MSTTYKREPAMMDGEFLHIFAAVKRHYVQIEDRVKALGPKDYFGFETSALLAYLPWQYANKYLKPAPMIPMGRSEQASQWMQHYPLSNPPLEQLKKYLPYAWAAANEERGYAVLRALAYARALLWLGGWSDKVLMHFDTWSFYGKPELILCSYIVGFNWQVTDNRRWSMGNGKYLSDFQRQQALITTLETVHKYQPDRPE